MKEEKFIYRPFNGTFWLIVAGYIAFSFGLCYILNGYDLAVRKTVMLVICGCVIVYYFIYKYQLSKDKEYDELYYSKYGGFTWWMELPFHLCNINMFLGPIGILTSNRYIMGFAFFIGPVGTAMAILMPSHSFNNFSIFKKRMLGYYGTHFSIMFNCILLCPLGFYMPQYSDVLPIALVGTVVSFVIFLFNMVLRKTGIATGANYFYTCDPDENKVLLLSYKLIPHKYLFIIPLLIAFIPYMYLVTFIVHLIAGI